jgi:hypothetical protein
MLEQLAFALVAVALAAPFLVPLLWSQLGQSSQDMAAVVQDERPIGPVGRKIATVGAVIIAASAFVQTADAQQSWRPLPNDPEQFRMIEECLELTFGRSGGKETARMYEACLEGFPVRSPQKRGADQPSLRGTDKPTASLHSPATEKAPPKRG